MIFTLSRMRRTYPTDLSDAEWISLKSYLPTPIGEGRPRTILCATSSTLSSTCLKVAVIGGFRPMTFLPGLVLIVILEDFD
jgi:hypothetical protein